MASNEIVTAATGKVVVVTPIAKASDRVQFAAAAHRLAGASLNVGALFVAGVCHSIEVAMSGNNARPSASLMAALAVA